MAVGDKVVGAIVGLKVVGATVGNAVGTVIFHIKFTTLYPESVGLPAQLPGFEF